MDDSGYIYIADGEASVVRKMSPIIDLRVGVKEIAQPIFDIYPNPSAGKFTITPGKRDGHADITISNTLGQCIYNDVSDGYKTGIDLTGHPAGIYFIRYRTSYGETTRKLILQ